MNIVLASASPRRKEILKGIGLDFSVITADIDEGSRDFSVPDRAVQGLAIDKGRAVRKQAGDALIIAADTIVCVEGEVMGKPHDRQDAAKMLRRLSNCAHEVLTGVAVLYKGKEAAFCEKTRVYFKEISDREIEAYINTGEPMDKAGAYAIQGMGGVFVSGITGDYLNVVGLPLSRLYDFLRSEFGIDIMEGMSKNV